MARQNLAVLFLLIFAGRGGAAAPREIPGFSLHDSRGALHSLSDESSSRAVVVVFLGVECPLAKLYAPRLEELRQRFGPQGAAFIGVNSNDQDTLREIGAYAARHQLGFPVLKDPGQKVADMFGADRTPMAFVLDADRVVRYQGRIDDQFGIGYSRAAPERQELAEAIQQVLAGAPVAHPVTKAVGCLIGRPPTGGAGGEVTYHNQVARLLNQHCVRCHRAGQIAPFALTDYDEAAAWSRMMVEVVDEGRMPPWHANKAHGRFSNDARMPDRDKQLLRQWVEEGAPRGDPSDAPPPVRFVSAWQIPAPDKVLAMREPFVVPAHGVVPYQYFEVDAGFNEDVWVTASEIRPGNPAVVHHAFAFFLPPGQEQPRAEDPLFNAIAAFAPGMPATLWPENHARLVPAGSRIVLQLHYTPTGSEQRDQTRVGLVFAPPSELPKEVQFGIAVDLNLKIPPHAPDHRVRANYTFTQDTILHALIPHMHYRGKAFRFTAIYPGGRREILLDVPNYDFNWQNAYALTEPKLMPKHTTLVCDGVYDNSVDNPANPDPDREVRWGDQSWDEMMLGSFTTSLPDGVKPSEYPKVELAADGAYSVVFRYRPSNRKARRISVAGTFNDWNGDRDLLKGPDNQGYYWATLRLPRGHHEYKFVEDGSLWTYDPENPLRTGPFVNSVVRVVPTSLKQD